MLPDLRGKRIAILATSGFEQSELLEPRRRLTEVHATVEVVSPKAGEIRGWKDGDWGDSITVDKTIGEVDVAGYDALVLPGGQINPDVLRTDKRAVALVRSFVESGKPVAAICHGPWMLAEAGVVRGRRITSYHSIRTDLTNAGARWSDQAVVRDGNLVTSRKPDDLPEFIAGIADAVAEPPASHRQAAS